MIRSMISDGVSRAIAGLLIIGVLMIGQWIWRSQGAAPANPPSNAPAITPCEVPTTHEAAVHRGCH